MKKSNCILYALALATAITTAVGYHYNELTRKVKEERHIRANARARQLALHHLNIDRQKVMPYVTCTTQTVDTLLAIADTVFSKTQNYTLEDLSLTNDQYNHWIQQDFHDTIPTIVALYASYDALTRHGHDEANASFVWHEVAKSQMKEFLVSKGYKGNMQDGIEHMLRIAESIMGTYAAGTQADINLSAWRQATLTDFHLIEAYKQLIDTCKDPEVPSLAHQDYEHMLQVFREYCKAQEEWYSDLPRQQACQMAWLMESKLSTIKSLSSAHQKKRLSSTAVKKSLAEHIISIGRYKDTALTTDMLTNQP